MGDNTTIGSMSDQTADPQLLANPRSASKDKAVVVGVYGIPGSGKTSLLNLLKQELGTDSFAFYDGSEVIASVVPGGLHTFQTLEENEKEHWRKSAIDKIGGECTESRKVGVVAGHFMFWQEGEDVGRVVCTEHDLNTFTCILYLDVPAGVVAQRRQNDLNRHRPFVSIDHLSKWQEIEKTELQRLCRANSILFSLLSSPRTLLEKASVLLQDVQHHTEEYNLSQAQRKLDKILASQGQRETVLVMDADRTLAAVDTGKLFWERVSKSEDSPLKALFGGPLGYSYTAFRQAVLLYEEAADDQEFDELCRDVAAEVTMHPEFLSLLHLVANYKHVGAIVVTCGLRQIWDKVLEREGLSETVSVLGGGRLVDGFVVTAAVKAAVVARLQDVYQVYVWAFGDSPLDLEMLCKADEAIVVSGEEESRSKSMDAALTKAIEDGLQARQAVLPRNATPRLDTAMLPLVQLTQPYISSAGLTSAQRRRAERRYLRETQEKFASAFVDSVLLLRRLQVFQATEKTAAQLLMTPTRDARVAGPALREAHRRIGWYLGTEFLASVIGVEQITIPHVQGHQTNGHRLLHEQQTSIVALMRGGEPMALGVNDAFPLAMFVHASCPEDIKLHHLQEHGAVVLVDSVLNSGKTVVDFVQAIRNLHATIRIVVVAGVVQAESVSGGRLEALGRRYGNVSLVALRLSNNKFTGSGTTDTGNRLFNSTHLA
ncbi:uracil phosphoribosyltransferase [Setomelanomma holmii]|uniref:Uracil phosphoribosyltransferase n=1 Tax=Setomelanomma holmii TaxID=210430 RepID=A0A9P4LDX1_9PLEO|nr:uracil phosphoribosyltransferase [Setomelanomma holmii]